MYYLPTVLYSDRLLIPVACFNYRRVKPAWIETHKALPVTPSSFPFANPTFSNERKQLQHFPLWKLEETQIPNSLLSRAPASVYVHARARALSVRTHTTANSLDLTPGLFLFHSRLAKRMRSTLPPPTAVNHSSYGLNKLQLTLEILRSAARAPSLFPPMTKINKISPFVPHVRLPGNTRTPRRRVRRTHVEGNGE